MNNFKKTIACILLIVIVIGSALTTGFSQVRITESENIPMFHGSIGVHLPYNDLAVRFGPNTSIAAGHLFKTKKNWLIGIDYQYLFGNMVKEDNILDILKTENGNFLNSYGEYGNVILYQRGFFSGLRIGKLIPLGKKSPNSGIIITSGVGLLQHKIWITNEGNNVPQLIGEYKKGYDRLTNGLAIQEFVGYLYVGKNQFTNFFAGVEFTQAWTQNRRSINYDTKITDTTKRIDTLWGIRFGWIVPIYRGVSGSYYY